MCALGFAVTDKKIRFMLHKASSRARMGNTGLWLAVTYDLISHCGILFIFI